jgi:hypothetical protein
VKSEEGGVEEKTEMIDGWWWWLKKGEKGGGIIVEEMSRESFVFRLCSSRVCVQRPGSQRGFGEISSRLARLARLG